MLELSSSMLRRDGGGKQAVQKISKCKEETKGRGETGKRWINVLSGSIMTQDRCQHEHPKKKTSDRCFCEQVSLSFMSTGQQWVVWMYWYAVIDFCISPCIRKD
jgi:hypothetical protein